MIKHERIKKQEAIDAIASLLSEPFAENDSDVTLAILTAEKAVRSLVEESVKVDYSYNCEEGKESYFCRCPECGRPLGFLRNLDFYNYCPSCGCKLDLEVD